MTALIFGWVALLPASAWAQARGEIKTETKAHRLALQISDIRWKK